MIQPTILTQDEEIKIRGVTFNIKDLLKETYKLSQLSPDLSTQNGAILVDWKGNFISSGINCFPYGVEYKPERLERPLKYKYTEHAERAAIFSAARMGKSTEGSIMICQWAACGDCCRGIIDSGVTTLISHKQAFDRSPENWLKEIEVAFIMMKESGIKTIWYDGIVGTETWPIQVRHSGKVWEP
jgi:dCMP deaminase